MKSTISTMKLLKESLNFAIFSLSGSIDGMAKNSRNMASVMIGIRNTPQNLLIVPLTSLFMPQWDAIGSGRSFQWNRPASVAIPIIRTTNIVAVLVDIFAPFDGKQIVFHVKHTYSTYFLSALFLFAWGVVLRQRDDSAQAAEIHRIHSAAGDDDQRAFLFQAFEEHIHGAQVQCGGVVDIRLSGFSKRGCDLHFRFA